MREEFYRPLVQCATGALNQRLGQNRIGGRHELLAGAATCSGIAR